jgi:arsenate reductase (glutaredoxin)
VSALTFYEKPTCTTCRRTAKLLAERGVDFERVDYYVDPLGEDKLRELLRKAGLRPREAMRTKEPVYRQLGLAQSDLPDDELIRLMAEHPDLVQRPIVERGDRAVLARPPEKVLELLD